MDVVKKEMKILIHIHCSSVSKGGKKLHFNFFFFLRKLIWSFREKKVSEADKEAKGNQR